MGFLGSTPFFTGAFRCCLQGPKKVLQNWPGTSQPCCIAAGCVGSRRSVVAQPASAATSNEMIAVCKHAARCRVSDARPILPPTNRAAFSGRPEHITRLRVSIVSSRFPTSIYGMSVISLNVIERPDDRTQPASANEIPAPRCKPQRFVAPTPARVRKRLAIYSQAIRGRTIVRFALSQIALLFAGYYSLVSVGRAASGRASASPQYAHQHDCTKFSKYGHPSPKVLLNGRHRMLASAPHPESRGSAHIRRSRRQSG